VSDIKRQHPLSLVAYTKRKFWLLLIPLIRSLFALDFDFFKLLGSSLSDLLFVAAVLLYAFLQYRTTFYHFGEKSLHIKTGIIFRSEFSLEYRLICSAASNEEFFLRPFGATVLSVESEAKSAFNKRRAADITLITPSCEAVRFIGKLRREDKNRRARLVFGAPRSMLILFSLLFSNALASGVYLAVLFSQSFNILGKTLESYFIDTFNYVSKIMSDFIIGIPSYAVIAVIVIICGFTFSFFSNILRYVGFRVYRKGKIITVKSGYFSKRLILINTDFINYADFRQNLIMKAMGVYSLHVGCIGYGKRRGEIPVFIPLAEREELGAAVKMFLPDFADKRAAAEDFVKPQKPSFVLYMWLPVLLVILFAAAFFILINIFPKFSELILFVFLMAEIPSVVFTICCLIEYKTSGIAEENGFFEIKYRRFWSFHYVLTKHSKIVKINRYASPYYRRTGISNTYIMTRGEKGIIHRLRGGPAGIIFT
jgi:putative membrane protein